MHLNGRVYDTLFGRMMSPDPGVPDAMNPQAWIRYSYVGNDPLALTDTTGVSWLLSFFHSIASFFEHIFASPIVRAIVQIAIAATLTASGVEAIAAATTQSLLVYRVANSAVSCALQGLREPQQRRSIS